MSSRFDRIDIDVNNMKMNAALEKEKEALKSQNINQETARYFQSLMKKGKNDPEQETTETESVLTSGLTSSAGAYSLSSSLSKSDKEEIISGAEINPQLPTMVGPLLSPLPFEPSAKIDTNDSHSKLDTIINEVAESLWVASSSTDGDSPHIRVALKETILPKTEVQIHEGNHQLVVQFITTSSIAYQWLDQRLHKMKFELERTLRRPINLSVSDSTTETTSFRRKPEV